MLATLTLKKNHKKKYAPKHVKNYLKANQNTVNMLKHSILLNSRDLES